MSMDYTYSSEPVAYSAASERARFIKLTYLHVGAALLAFVGVLGALFNLVPEATLMGFFQTYRSAGFVLMFLFVGVGMAADWLSLNTSSRGIQYLGLGLGVVLEAIIVFPLLFIAQRMTGGQDMIQSAAVMSIFAFSGLTIGVLASGRDFSWLRSIVVFGGFLMMGVILAAIFFPASVKLGLWFGLLAIGLTCVTILYQTSNVMHRYRTDQYVGASLALFSSLATLFYYILYVLMQANRSR